MAGSLDKHLGLPCRPKRAITMCRCGELRHVRIMLSYEEGARMQKETDKGNGVQALLIKTDPPFNLPLLVNFAGNTRRLGARWKNKLVRLQNQK